MNRGSSSWLWLASTIEVKWSISSRIRIGKRGFHVETSILSSDIFHVMTLSNVINVGVLTIHISNPISIFVSVISSCSERETIARVFQWIIVWIIRRSNWSWTILIEIVFSNYVFAPRSKTSGSGSVYGRIYGSYKAFILLSEIVTHCIYLSNVYEPFYWKKLIHDWDYLLNLHLIENRVIVTSKAYFWFTKMSRVFCSFC